MSGSKVNITTLDGAFEYNTTTTLYAGEQSSALGSVKSGYFQVVLPEDLNNERFVRIRISGGESIDADLDGVVDDAFTKLGGTLEFYVSVSSLRDENVTISAISLFANALLDQNITEELLADELQKSVERIYRLPLAHTQRSISDLYGFIPNKSESRVLNNPKLLQELYTHGFMELLFQGGDVRVLMSSDEDGDGIVWQEELLAGTDPKRADSDGDGLEDPLEISSGLNPLSSDSDFDTLLDSDEQYGSTNPAKSDSDGDYLPDNFELMRGSDPNNADENGNAILDGLEGDPLFQYQWHLLNDGSAGNNTKGVENIAGNDLGILSVYGSVLGKSTNYETIVQVVDTGVEALHEDLDIDTFRSFNAINKTTDPTATEFVSSIDKTAPLVVGHGTAVAGIVAAKANNGKGVRGVVPYAKIAGSNWLEEQSIYELERLWFSGKGANEIQVSNNSWGGYFINDESYEEILALATKQLRDGKGRIFVFAGGNERQDAGNSNLSYLTNNRFGIAVASLNHEKRYASYSNPGSNILVSAYGGEFFYTAPTIATTLLTGRSYYESELGGQKGALTVDEDTARSYTIAFNGTSSAAPMVSGAIALTLQACPTLSYRDVRRLVAHTAIKVDENSSEWIQNGAGLWHSINYGYGLVNAKGMIDECRSRYFTHLPQELNASVALSNINQLIADNNTTQSYTLNFTEEIEIEWVGLHVDTDHPYCGDLSIELISPQGTATSIVKPNEVRFNGYEGGFRFGSNAFMDENAQGVWHVRIRDEYTKDSGILKSIKLEIYGH
ncbi:MAG: S8 family serine peptidase [Epsilonproteobacteria bacterium]|nr:S8 family serine peptidase [Campylobacterota bacterium]